MFVVFFLFSCAPSVVVVVSSLSCSPSNDGTSFLSLIFPLSLFLLTSPCCHCFCCSRSLPSSITASVAVVESSLSCSPSNDGTSLFFLSFSLSSFLPSSPCCHRCCCSCSLPSSITASVVVVESSFSCSPSNDGTSLFFLSFSLSSFLPSSPCCHHGCCSRSLPSSITASVAVVESSLSCSPSNDGTSLFFLSFSLSSFLPSSPCCHRCCCSCSLPSSITASVVVVESSFSCSPSNDGTSLFFLSFSLSSFLPSSPCCHHGCCSRSLPSSITASGVVVDGSSSSDNGDDEPNPKSESSDILIDVR